MVARKRAREEMESSEPSPEPSPLQRLRNMPEFASLMQYIFMFGKCSKIDDDLDIDDLEAEFLKPFHSDRLSEVGLALLKMVSSHRGLTPDLFDEYARRQYVAKAQTRNPFGEDEEPRSFTTFDMDTKVHVLHQLSVWTLYNPDRIREKMPEAYDYQQTAWRIEPFGWDADDHTYYLLDDDRLYRRIDPPIPTSLPKAKPKPKSKSRKTRSTRASKRGRLSVTVADTEDENEEQSAPPSPEPGMHGMRDYSWACICITLEDYQSFIESIRRSRDPNEKALHKRLVEEVLPIIEKRAEEQQKKVLRKQKELENLQKLATAKRSSRIAGKAEKQKEAEEAAALERKREAELQMAYQEQKKQKKMEEARQSRIMTREARVREREVKRILHEEELAKLEANKDNLENNDDVRGSHRHVAAELSRKQAELEQFKDEEPDWYFDCSVCGVHGENIDDGTHSIACDKCNVWQHSACHQIDQTDAERDDFHFICGDCKRKAELKPIKIRLSNSPQATRDQKDTPSDSAKKESDHQTPPQASQLPHKILLQNPTSPEKPTQASSANQPFPFGPKLSPPDHTQTSPSQGVRESSPTRYNISHPTPPALPSISSLSMSNSIKAAMHSSTTPWTPTPARDNNDPAHAPKPRPQPTPETHRPLSTTGTPYTDPAPPRFYTNGDHQHVHHTPLPHNPVPASSPVKHWSPTPSSLPRENGHIGASPQTFLPPIPRPNEQGHSPIKHSSSPPPPQQQQPSFPPLNHETGPSLPSIANIVNSTAPHPVLPPPVPTVTPAAAAVAAPSDPKFSPGFMGNTVSHTHPLPVPVLAPTPAAANGTAPQKGGLHASPNGVPRREG